MFTYGAAFSTRTGDDWKRPRGVSSRIIIFAFTLLVVCLPFGVDAQTIPNPPSNLVASVVSLAQIKLSWSDASTNESGFKVERSLDGVNFTQIAQVLSNVTSYRNTGLFPNRTYSYRVRAYNVGGNSAYSSVVNVGTPALCPTAVVGWGNNSDSELVMPPGLTNVVAISAGDYHNLALKSDGTVVGWGYNCCGETSTPAGVTGVVAVAAGDLHSLALKSDGTVVGWGWNGYGQASPPAGLTGVIAVAAGALHSLALKSDGTVVGWGDNSSGETNAPAGLAGVVAIGAGYDYSVALKSDGTVVAWGYNNYGEGSSPGVTNAVAIAAGLYHGLALRSDGTVFGWGYGGSGATSPPGNLTNAVAIAAGYLHSLAVRSDGPVVGWGDNTDGDLMPPAGLTGVSAVEAGIEYSLALTSGLLPPSGLTASALSSNQVNLAWSYAAGNEDGFDIERAPDNGGNPGTWAQVATVGANATTYPDTGVTTNTTYWYRVRAYNVCVDSPYSTQVSVVTAPPPAPLNLTAFVANTNQINLSWSSSYPDETGFKVERALDNGGSPGTWAQIATVGSNVATYADTGRALNTTYWYRVRAYNAVGDSPYSNLASAIACDGQFVRVMQWNVEGHIGSVFSNNTVQAQAIARIVNYNQPDILLFCELEDHGIDGDTAGLINWVTNNIPYLGSQTGSTFYVSVATASDGFERNGAISRFPISNDFTYSDGLRGLHAFQVRFNGVTALQIYHAHLKCCSDGNSCDRKQSEAQGDADIINGFAAASFLPYIFGGDWNEDEQNPECTLSASYHPITTIRETGGLVEFKPTTLDGEYRTWSTDPGGPSIRFDYMLAATNRLAPSSGYVFSSMVWGNHGLYTDNPQNGYSDSYNASDHYCVFADYFFPNPHFTVTPTSTFVSSGYVDGPFAPSNRVCTLSNMTASSLSWGVTNSASWLTILPTNGTLAGGATVDVTMSINPTAKGLAAGNYSDTISFNNRTNGASVTVKANLAVQLLPAQIQAWQIQYFASTGNPAGALDADPDGDGMNNLREFLTGTDPTNSVSCWGIQASPTNGASPLTVSFTENSTGPSITNRLWDFGDGGTGSGAHPNHTYTSAGTFSVGLTIFNLYGTATLVAPNLITVAPVAIWTNANGSGNWSAASNWDPVAIPDHGCGVVFGTAGVTAMVDNVSRTVSNITFSRSGDFFVATSGGAGLTISNGVTVATDFTYTISAPVVVGGTNTWSVTTNGTLQVSGPVSGPGPITETGGGTVILSGTNAYSGGTTISNGTLKVVGTGLMTNTVSINIVHDATLDVSGRTGGSMMLVSGQTLKGGGTVRGDLILADGSALSPGSSAGTLTFLNDLVVSNAAVLQFDLGTNSDLIAVSSNLTLGGTLNINDAGGLTVGVYTLFTYGGTLAYNGVAIGTLPSGRTWIIDTNTSGQVRLNVVPAGAIEVIAADLQDRLGNLMPVNGVAVLVVDPGNNGFVDPEPAFLLSVGATWGGDNKVLAVWDLSANGLSGVLDDVATVPYTSGIGSGQQLQLYWFPALTLASNTVGVTYYGKYRDTNGPPLDNSDPWNLPTLGGSAVLQFITQSEGGSNPDAAGRATLFAATSPVPRFTASPASGAEPLAVTFTDTSTGTAPLNLSWNLGDSTTTNTTGGASFVHAYPAGTYTVTLTASNSLGGSTILSNNLITALTVLQAWQLRYFGCTGCAQAADSADPDGDGMNNLEEFLTGTDPTNNASVFRITEVRPDDDDVLLTWTAVGGKRYILQAATGDRGNFSNNFVDLNPAIVAPGTGETEVGVLHLGAATNFPSRFYRIRLVP